MGLDPRPYQHEAINTGLAFYKEKKKYNGLIVLPTGSGKSLVIAKTAEALPGKTVVLQPSKEILEQNFSKYLSYGGRAGIYSASAGMKYLDTVTFAMIGSIANKHHLFERFNNIIIDECHMVNPEDGMYHDFIKSLDHAKVLGFTATPYRLSSGFGGAMLKFLNRQTPRIFNKVLYYVQNDTLFNAGYLAPLEYYNLNVVDRTLLQSNSTGTDFTDASIKSYYRRINMPAKIIGYANRVLAKRRNLIVFCSLVEEAIEVAQGIPGAVVVHGKTDKDLRNELFNGFKSGTYRCLVNVGTATTGFDFPGLEAALIGKSTMSLALYYQMIGRIMRPFTYPDGSKKRGWVLDMGGNINLFGKVETMKIQQTDKGLYYISNNGKQLTNVTFTKN